MPINRAVGVGLCAGLVFAGVAGVFGGNFGVWLAVGLLLGVAGCAGVARLTQPRAPRDHAGGGQDGA